MECREHFLSAQQANILTLSAPIPALYFVGNSGLKLESKDRWLTQQRVKEKSQRLRPCEGGIVPRLANSTHSESSIRDENTFRFSLITFCFSFLHLSSPFFFILITSCGPASRVKSTEGPIQVAFGA